MTVVFAVSGADTYETALPAGCCCQFHCHCDALPQRPPPPVLLPKSVRGRALASAVKELIAAVVGGVSPRSPGARRYQVRAVVPGTGKAEKSLMYPG